MISQCPICENSDFQLNDRFSDYLMTDENNQLFTCMGCGLNVRDLPDEKFTDEDRLRISKEKNFLLDGEYTAGTKTANPKMLARLKSFEKKLNSSNRNLLDIGCGTGSFLDLAHANGWNVCGTDINYYKNKLGTPEKKFPIFDLNIATETHKDLKKQSFDLIHMNHILEHTHNPNEIVDAAILYLKPGGYICAEVPNEIGSAKNLIKLQFGKKSNSATSYFGHCTYFSNSLFRRLFED